MNKKIVKNGIVYEINEYEEIREIGKIARVELSIEHPAQMLGISRIESSVLLDNQETELNNDQDIVDNQEYHSDEELIKAVAKHYNISTDLVDII